MVSRWFVQWSGPFLMLGGVLWAASAIVHARQPMGCIADDCYLPGRSMRQGSQLGATLAIAAILVLAAGVLGLVFRARAAGHFSRMGNIGLGLSTAGVIGIFLASLVQALFFNGDFPGMPYVLLPSGLAVIVGCVLLGIAILRSGILPRWASALLILGTVVMLGMNEQTTRVLLMVPFGLAWAVIGGILWLQRGDVPVPAVATG